MRTIRVHVAHPLVPGGEVILPAQAAAHAVRVLRLRTGDPLVLFNDDGNDYESVLVTAEPREVRVRVGPGRMVATESGLRITLAQALARGEKMDWIVQKATELGVTAIVPLITEHSEVRLDAARAQKRVDHWNAVAAGACEQCGRARLPRLEPPASLESWLAILPGAGTRLALLPDGTSTLRALRPVEAEVVLAIGPEGGFGERDLAALHAANFRGLRLGPRVLRTETAGIAAIAALQGLYGDF